MGKTIAVSFEGNQVKIVHASLKGPTLSVDRTETIPDDNFDAYLQGDKAKEYIVTCEFKGAHHGVFTVPIVKAKYLGKIIESKIRKASGEKDFAFIYRRLGERTVENRKALEVFYYAVSNTDLKNIAVRFYDNGKTVKALYPSVFSAVSLIGPGEEGEGFMGVFSTGNERVVFSTKNGAVNFIRNYESDENGLTDFDIQNLNMTVTYCFQNLRIYPSSVLLMGNLSGSSDITTLPSAPLADLTMSDNIHCSRETYNDFILPIASFFTPGPSNILGREFKNINSLKSYFAYASMIFIIMAVLCMGLMFNEAKDTSGKKQMVTSSAENIADIENIFSEYVAREDRIRQYRPAVEFMNRPSPDIYKLLIALGGINIRDLKFNSIEAGVNDGSSLIVEVSGTSYADTYSLLQASFKDIIDTLKKTEHLEVTNKSIDLANNTFKIEMNYKTQ